MSFASNLKARRAAPPTSNSLPAASCPLPAVFPSAQSSICNLQSTIPNVHEVGLVFAIPKNHKNRLNSQTRIKHISFKFMYVTVLLVKIICYSFL
jgi:hypothetical protein